eukprot:XP_014005048.1 PREDICTED: nardilysin-like [Salmo salar]
MWWFTLSVLRECCHLSTVFGLATDFTLKPSDCPDTDVPVRIVNNERGCLWFKKVWGLVLFDIFVNILAHNLAELAYEADVSQLEYKLIAGDHGLVIGVKGFNHKLPGHRGQGLQPQAAWSSGSRASTTSCLVSRVKGFNHKLPGHQGQGLQPQAA